MDPNANLAEQERILQGGCEAWTMRQRGERGQRMAELRQALYDWIRNGGFEPDWTIAPIARKHFGR